MISTLHIRNIGIIKDLTIDFNNGFNVLTGETGAGKTLIIKSIDMVCGGRFSKDMIKKDEEFASVEACIHVSNEDKSFSDEYIIVSRQVYLNGKNLCKIDGRLVSVTELKNFMKDIIDIHGQYDNQSLMDSKTHIEFLNEFCKDSIKDTLDEYKKLYLEYKNIEEKLSKNYGDDIERQRKLDLLNYQLNEIKEANLEIEEEARLEEKKEVMKNFEKISEALNITTFKLENNILVELENIIKPLEKIENFNKEYSSRATSIKNMYYDLQEYLSDFNNYKENLEYDEQEFDLTEKRLDMIHSLKRKYGNTIEDILKYKEELEIQIKEIENLEEYNMNLKNEQETLKNKMRLLANKLNVIREENANILQVSVNNNLNDLEMNGAIFKVNILYDNEDNFNINGLNRVEFLVTTNVGEDFKPLVKIASGGEIARIMLAIKSVLSDVDKVSTIIFDEIDTGISGSVVKAVAEKIKCISKNHQVIAVTHQAILTASADYNYKVMKNVKEGKTTTNISLLNEKEIVEEIAKIATGSVTATAIKHALELRGVRAC